MAGGLTGAPGATGATRSARLVDAARGDLAAAAGARLITEITAGTVDPAAYARYLLIEEEFVRTAARVLGAAVWHAPDDNATAGHARALFGLVTEQRDYFARTRADWPAAAELGAQGRRQAAGLSGFVLRAAADHGYPAIVTALFAAEHLYLTWCTAAAALDAARPAAVREWVDLHARAPFTDQVAFLRAEVDALDAGVGDPALLEWFTGMLAEETHFHDAVYG